MFKSVPEEPWPPIELGAQGHYSLPPAADIPGVVFPSAKAPLRIRLILETGHELDIPVTQDLLKRLFESLRSVVQGS